MCLCVCDVSDCIVCGYLILPCVNRRMYCHLHNNLTIIWIVFLPSFGLNPKLLTANITLLTMVNYNSPFTWY